MLTLRDLLHDLDVRHAAGEAGLDASVRWVHISELEDPTPWLSGGELLLTTGMQLTDAQRQAEYVARLAGHGLTGLGLGTGFAHEAAPEAMVAAAEEYGFPLFEVPYELPFIALTEKAFTHLVNEQYAVMRRALTAHERLENIVLSEQGLDGVVAALASLIGGSAAVFDARGEVLAADPGRELLDAGALAEVGAELLERSRSGGRRNFAPGGRWEGRSLALPVARATSANGLGRETLPQAWLVGAKDAGSLTEFDRLTLHQAVTIVALELLRRRMADDTERRLAGDVLSALVSGELAGPELARRLEPFGLRDGTAMLVLAPPRSVKAAVEGAARGGVRDGGAAGLVAGTARISCALFAHRDGGGDEDLFASAERVRRARPREVGVDLAAGPGRAVPAGGGAARLPRGPLRARGALAGRRRRRRPGHRTATSAPSSCCSPPGRRRAAAVLRLDPRADRGGRGRLRRRADALARGVHRVQRAVGARRAPPVLPSAYAALSHPSRGGADGPLARLRPRSHRLLARPPRSRAGTYPEREEQMKVGVPTEIKTDEYRVALTPSGVRELVEHGHEVVVQAGAGEGSAISDEDYTEQGARVLPDAAAVFGEADMIVKVKEPQAPEVALLEPRHTLFTYLHLAPDPELTRGLMESGATCVAYETVEDSRGPAAAAAPMSEVAGKIATQAGAFMLEKPLGGRGILLGGVPGVAAASVMVIGGGVVGMNAGRSSPSA
jgi:purine catabolism regulator